MASRVLLLSANRCTNPDPVFPLGLANLSAALRRSPNWIVGDPDPSYQKFVNRLRQRGIAGPLWSYFSPLHRLWPQGMHGGIQAAGSASSS